MRYHAHPNGTLALDDDPTPVVQLYALRDRGAEVAILAELATDGNHAREWAQRAAEIVAINNTDPIEMAASIKTLLREMAAYAREQVTP